MATIFRKKVTRKLPADAELFTRKGELCARWRDRSGKKQTAQVVEGRDGSQRIRTEAGTYTAKYRDGSGVVREIATGCKLKDAAQSVLRELVRRAEQVRAGVMSVSEDAVRDWLTTDIQDSLSDYVESLKSNGRSESHIADCQRLAGRVFRDCSMKLMRDIAGTPIERWLNARSLEGISPRTRNSYLQAVRGFCRWCVTSNRLAIDPTKQVIKPDESSDCRRKRRSLTPEELERLLYVARWRPLAEYGRQTVVQKISASEKYSTRKRVPLSFDELPSAIDLANKRLNNKPEFVAELEFRGLERALVYKSLVLTGLRRGELASLRISSAVLDSEPPYLILDAGNAKNRKQAELPLRDDLADDLRMLIIKKRKAYCRSFGENVGILSVDTGEPVNLPHDTPLLNVPSQMVKTLDRDLAVAGIAKRDDRGQTIDVHALRHSFGSLLSAGGVAPRTAQAALRHSSIDLTMNVYTDPRVLDVAGALDALPALSLDRKPLDDCRQQATGTDDIMANRLVAPTVAPNSGNWSKLGAIADNSQEINQTNMPEKTPRKHDVSQGLSERRRPDSNRGCRICNPMP